MVLFQLQFHLEWLRVLKGQTVRPTQKTFWSEIQRSSYPNYTRYSAYCLVISETPFYYQGSIDELNEKV